MGEKEGSRGARKGCKEKQEAWEARPHWLSGGPVSLMTSLSIWVSVCIFVCNACLAYRYASGSAFCLCRKMGFS